jgi:hypothetical protein
MLQFIAGAIAGWTSARILPPPSEAAQRLSPPTLDEIQLLASKTKDFMAKIKEKLDEENKESPS